jgi:serine/threonine protein kinase
MPIQIKDEYDVLEEIGSGGMATVHKAMQKSLKRTVAIKELKKSYRADDQIVRRFERESIVAASLQHENIVHIYDYWKKPHYCIVMEYVDGANLADVINQAGALPVDVAVMIAIQVCSALEYAHMRGLIHRDIKPSNIMIRRNGEVKLMDFGIAHTRDLEALTLPGTMIGTPSYMSPEQIIGQNLDVRSDIFSFGIVLYELFTGMKPFVDEKTRAVSAKIVNDAFIRPRRINSHIPRSLQRVIKKCLAKKPAKRFGSMLEIEKKLGKQLAGRTTKAASLLRISDYLVSLNVIEPLEEQETLVITARPSRGGRFKRALAAASMLIALAAGGSYYYFTKYAVPARYLESPAPVAASPVPAAQSSVSTPPVATRPQSVLTPPAASAAPAPGALASSPTTTATSLRKASPEYKKPTSRTGKKKTAVKKKKKKVSSS